MSSPESSVPTVDANELERLSSAGKAVIVDVRDGSRFAAEHIPGARSMPFDGGFDAGRIEVRPGQHLIFQCELGILSERAARTAMAQGADSVAHLAGGIRAWKRAGLAVEGARPRRIGLQRQVQIIAGSLVVAGSLLGALVSLWWLLLAGGVGAGLLLAGTTGRCGMTAVLLRLPFNQPSVRARS